MSARRAARAASIAAALVVGACAGPPPDREGSVDPTYRHEIEAWRAERVERLTAADGYLTLAGLFWLDEGDSSFGAGSSNAIVLPAADGVPERAGVLRLGADGAVTLEPEVDVALSLDGQPVQPGQVLHSDTAGDPDVLHLGRLSLYVIARGDRLAIRVKDPESATRRGFAGLEYFPIDPAFRVTARLEAFDEPRPVSIATMVGTTEEMLAPGVLHFTVDGRDCSLLPLTSGPEDRDLFLIFRDLTSGDTTYGAGRFLSAELRDDGRAELDFNRAYNPPCAFTPHATCPLPPADNVLEIAVTAGEKAPSGH
jgi:uncharacterized protein (DUF1684 family)